jgi:hypothetical protein
MGQTVRFGGGWRQGERHLRLANLARSSNYIRLVDEPDNESDFLFEFWAWLEANRLSAIIVIGVALIGGFYLYVSQF